MIAVAVRPSYFENFYALVGQTPGSFYALVRSDGAILARVPHDECIRGSSARTACSTDAIRNREERGLFTVKSEIDRIPRRIGFRKLEGFPVYALAGTETGEIQARMDFSDRLVSDVRPARGTAASSPCCGSRSSAPSGCMRKPSAAKWRKMRCARRNGSKRSAN